MKYLFALTLTILLVSCGTSTIGFITHQPEGIKPKLHFNKCFTGTFKTEDTSLVLINFNETFSLKSDDAMKIDANNYVIITDNQINNKIEGDLFLLKDSLSSMDKYKLLYLHDFDSIITKNIENPTYIYSIDSIDSWYRISFNINSLLFKISDTNVYKEFKGKFYLNRYNTKEESWNCTQIECFEKGRIISINSASQDDLSIIERLTEIQQKQKNNNSKINPSKRTFKKFLRLQGFEDKIRLVKTK